MEGVVFLGWRWPWELRLLVVLGRKVATMALG